MFSTKLWNFLANKAGSSREDQHDFCLEIIDQLKEIHLSHDTEIKSNSKKETLLASKTQLTLSTSAHSSADVLVSEQSAVPTSTKGKEVSAGQGRG